MIRLLDIVFSLAGLLVLSPFLLLIALCVALTSKGGVLYRQERVGRYGAPFRLYKFRTMRAGADKKGLLTVGGRDPRITPVGFVLRKLKLDELPQLYNVLKGDMSLVGPRPEVEKYTRLYTEEQQEVLRVRPGITDPASIYYRNESDVLARSSNPELTYIREILPHKLQLSRQFYHNPTLGKYFKYIFLTVFAIVKK